MTYTELSNCKVGDLVYCRWEDPRYCLDMLGHGAGWLYLEGDEDWEIPLLESVGFIVFLDDRRLVIASTRHTKEHDMIDPPLVLPLGCITVLHKFVLGKEENDGPVDSVLRPGN